MKALRGITLRVLMMAALLLLGQNIAFAGESGPTTTLKSTFHVADAPQQIQLVQQVLDFPPGAWTPAHSHGGLVFVTVAKGEISQFSDGKETTYKVGDTWTEMPGHAHQAGNTTSAPARTLVTFLLPPGAKQTTPQELAGAHASTVKTVAKVNKFDVPAVARPFDLVEMQLDFATGQQLPSHMFGGPAFISVLEGELSVQANGTQKAVKAGETWTETPGGFSTVVNEGPAPASAFVTVLLSRGATLMTEASQAKAAPKTLPTTGGASSTAPLASMLIPALPIVALIAAGGFLWRRKGARAPGRAR